MRRILAKRVGQVAQDILLELRLAQVSHVSFHFDLLPGRARVNWLPGGTP
jgi:hypothetical protein